MGTVVHRLAELASSVSFDQLPSEVVREAGRRLLDSLGCIIAGASGEPVKAAREAVMALGGGEEATLVGGNGRRIAADKATLVNCAALRYLDYMDGHPGPYSCHPCFNIPPVLAVAERAGASGAEVIRAIVLGYEMDIRLQLGSGNADISAYGWSGSSTLGISVPLAVGGLLGLSSQELAHAISISATHAPTLDATSRGQMAESKCCVDGMVAMSAVVATLLAKHGVTGPQAVFEGPGGYLEAVAGEIDEGLVLAPLDRFRILDVYTKRYNGVKCAQTAVAAALALRAALPGGWHDIRRVTLRLPDRDYQRQKQDEPSGRRPENRDTANHSAIYCVAAALVDGDLLPAQFAPQRLSDPEILDLVDRIELAADRELSRYWPSANPAEVEVVTYGGDLRSERVLYPPGHPRNPLTDEQIEGKFRGLAAGALSPEELESVLHLTRQVEELKSLNPLMELVGRAGRG